MAKKKKKKKSKSMPASKSNQIKNSRGQLVDPSTLPLNEALPLLKALSAQGRQKAALDAAKAIHAVHQSPESENLLAECYLDRIQGFLDKNMQKEALGLVELVRERFPHLGDRLASYLLQIDLQSGNLNTLLSPLRDPDLPREKRRAIEDIIRREATDLSLIAECEALPPDHDLRRAAADVWQAFRLVCSGPVSDDQIALASVSRKSPLASWKILVRAIAAFYRRDDETCRKLLDSLPSDAMPVRFAPVLLSAMASEVSEDPPPAMGNLAAKIAGFPEALHRCLKDVDEAMEYDPGDLSAAIKKAVTECKRTYPELLPSMKQRFYTHGFTQGVPIEFIAKALREPPVLNAAYWQQMARAFLMGEMPLHALAAWEEFRLHAIHEGLFEPKSVEESVLYQTMAKICLTARSDMDEFDDEWDELKDLYVESFHGYNDQPPAVTDAVTPEKRDPDSFYFIDPDKILARSCAGKNPDESYSFWLNTAKRYSGVRALDRIAEQWRQASPHSVQPLLHLAEGAERRKAFKKALSLVEDAERLDELNPSVRRLRLRLQMYSAGRHIQQKKNHLLEKDIQALKALPMIEEGDRPAIISGLGWVSALLDSNKDNGRRHFEALAEFFHGRLAAWLLCQALARFGGLKMSIKMPPTKEWTENGALLDAVTRVIRLGSETGIETPLPDRVETHLTKLLKVKAPTGTAIQFRILAEFALDRQHVDLAYTASGAGLALGGFTEARFLYLRTLCMQPFPSLRRLKCLSVAIHLAKRQGDQETASLALEALRDLGGVRHQQLYSQADLSPETVETVLRLEKGLRDPENQGRAIVKYEKTFHGEQGPMGHSTIDFVDFFDEDDDDYDEFPEDPDDFGVDRTGPGFEKGDSGQSPLELIEEMLNRSDAFEQMRLFPENPAQALLTTMFKVMEKFPDQAEFPDPMEVERIDPELAEEFTIVLLDYFAEYGEEPDIEEVIRLAFDQTGRKTSGKKRKTKKKARKKRK